MRELHDISVHGRAAKQNATLFTLALCARYTPKEVADYLAKSNEKKGEKDVEVVKIHSDDD